MSDSQSKILKLLDAHKAALYGVPAEDTTTEAIETALVAQHWSPTDARKHLDAAISAGVYERVEEPAAAHETKTPTPRRKPAEKETE